MTDAETITFVDAALAQAVAACADRGVAVEVLLDRLFTCAAAHAVIVSGSKHTAIQFRAMADNIEAGLFHGITGEGRRRN